MAKADVALVAGLAGFLLGGAAVYFAMSMQSKVEALQNVHISDNDMLAGLGAEVQKHKEELADLNRRVNSANREPQGMRNQLDALRVQVDKLMRAQGVVVKDVDPKDGAPKAPEAGAKSAAEEIAELQKKFFEGDATPDEQARFWQLLRENPEVLAGIMKELEKAVADNPRDLEARMKLGRAYITKLLTVPSGPEMGAWSNKAMAQYKAVLEQDPNHWDARYSLAFNYSQWPDFLNKTPDAIREFETLRKIQEQQTPDPKHAQTYFQLSLLYRKTGKPDLAKQVLEDGLRRHPDDEELKKALDSLK